MSHIDKFLDTIHIPTCKKADITSASKADRKNSSWRFSFAADLVSFMEENQYREVLEEVLMVQWQVFRCSPLWNVSVKESKDSVGHHKMVVDSVEVLYDKKALKRHARVIDMLPLRLLVGRKTLTRWSWWH